MIALQTNIMITPAVPAIDEIASVTGLTASSTDVMAESRFTAKSAAIPCKADKMIERTKCLLLIMTRSIIKPEQIRSPNMLLL